MKTVDIYVAGAKSVARNLASQHFVGHGFAVSWQSPWHGIARRGSFAPLALLFSNHRDAHHSAVQFDFRVMDAPDDDELSVLRLERRVLPTADSAQIVVQLADEFELIADEIVLDLEAHELVVSVQVYGVGTMIPPLTLPLPDPPTVPPDRPDSRRRTRG